MIRCFMLRCLMSSWIERNLMSALLLRDNFVWGSFGRRIPSHSCSTRLTPFIFDCDCDPQSELRVRHREECKNVTKLTMENVSRKVSHMRMPALFPFPFCFRRSTCVNYKIQTCFLTRSLETTLLAHPLAILYYYFISLHSFMNR